MMPQCNKNGCNKVAKVYLGKVKKTLKTKKMGRSTLFMREMCEKVH